jgi:hypothetical protein
MQIETYKVKVGVVFLRTSYYAFDIHALESKMHLIYIVSPLSFGYVPFCFTLFYSILSNTTLACPTLCQPPRFYKGVCDDRTMTVYDRFFVYLTLLYSAAQIITLSGKRVVKDELERM